MGRPLPFVGREIALLSRALEHASQRRSTAEGGEIV